MRQLIAAELRQPVPHGAGVLAERVRALLGEGVRAILFYGSCLRTQNDQHSLLDFYVFVDRYRSYTTPLWASLNQLLPPNVFYFETREGDKTYRLKYAVVSLDDLDRLTSSRSWQPYFWARFAQPCALVYAADEAAERRVAAACVRSLHTFIEAVLPLLPATFSARQLWQVGLSNTYRTELRSEPPGAAPQLYDQAPQRYEAVTRAAIAELPYPHRSDDGSAAAGQITVEYPEERRAAARRLWQLRVVEGKTLFLLRILKNWCTFEGGVEYVMWKIERHSGVKADPRWKEKRIRLFAVATEAWKAYRKGGFR
ncbi:MAG TPA: hypothetical protein VEB21_11540 [Terriglobales bacterium]|nr:hypothetical protein [Terriglobales bacterium]